MCTPTAPLVAPLGVPMVTITVSSASSSASSATVKVIEAVVWPAGISSGLAVAV